MARELKREIELEAPRPILAVDAAITSGIALLTPGEPEGGIVL